MCACSGLLQQRLTTCLPLPAAKQQHVQRQRLARTGVGPCCAHPVRGLPDLRLRRQLVSSRTRQHGPCHAAAEAAAVSQGPGPNPATSASSSSTGAPTPAASTSAGSVPPAAAGSSSGPSSNGSNSSNPSPVTGSSTASTPGTSAQAGAGPSAGNASGRISPGAAAAQEAPFSLKPVYVLIFTLLFLGGLLFASMSLQLTSDLGFRDALTKVVRRIFRCGEVISNP